MRLICLATLQISIFHYHNHYKLGVEDMQSKPNALVETFSSD